jgi:hypothetical protein
MEEEGRTLFRNVHAPGAIPNEMGPTRCRCMPASNKSADDICIPASQCLPVMPLSRLNSCLDAASLFGICILASAYCLLLDLEPWLGRRRGGQSGRCSGELNSSYLM